MDRQGEPATDSVCSSVCRFVEAIKERDMTETMITCPKCQTETKRTESLVAPIIESTIKKRKP